MIKDLIKNKIEECYLTNESFGKLLNIRFDGNLTDVVFSELNDFILSNDDVYESNNLMNLIYESFLELDESRFTHFLRNMVNEHPDRDRTYSHMINDIKESLDTTYQLPREYYSKTKYDLNKECDKLFLEGKFLQLKNTRQFINDNFRLERYESFVFENRDLAKVLLKKNDLDETDRVYMRIRELLADKPNLLGLFTYYNKVEKIGFGRLQTLYRSIMKNTDILDKLPQQLNQYMARRGNFRGPFTMEDGRTYNTFFEQLEDDLLKLEEIHKAKIFADAYPGEIKRDLHLNSDFQEIIRELTNNTDKSKEKLALYKNFWLNKVSRYKTQEELIASLTNFVFADSNVEDIKRQVESNYQLKMAFYDGELMVVRVLSYDAIQSIGSDTSWCIKDSLSYWTDYVSDNNVQLVIMDFTIPRTSPMRKIGVTINSNGNFSTAHNINDSYVNQDQINKILEKGNVTLSDMFEVAKEMGSNEYYEEEDISNDSYRGW